MLWCDASQFASMAAPLSNFEEKKLAVPEPACGLYFTMVPAVPPTCDQFAAFGLPTFGPLESQV